MGQSLSNRRSKYSCKKGYVLGFSIDFEMVVTQPCNETSRYFLSSYLFSPSSINCHSCITYLAIYLWTMVLESLYPKSFHSLFFAALDLWIPGPFEIMWDRDSDESYDIFLEDAFEVPYTVHPKSMSNLCISISTYGSFFSYHAEFAQIMHATNSQISIYGKQYLVYHVLIKLTDYQLLNKITGRIWIIQVIGGLI